MEVPQLKDDENASIMVAIEPGLLCSALGDGRGGALVHIDAFGKSSIRPRNGQVRLDLKQHKARQYAVLPQWRESQAAPRMRAHVND